MFYGENGMRGKAPVSKLKMFIDNLRLLNWIYRWDTYRRIKEENVAEHSFWVVTYSMLLADIEREIFGKEVDVEKVLRMAIIHDWEEAPAGDILHPVKTYNPEIRATVQKVANELFNHMVRLLDNRLARLYISLNMARSRKETLESKVVSAAELLSYLFYALDEYRLGNKHLTEVIQETVEDIKGMDLDSLNYVYQYYDNEVKRCLEQEEQLKSIIRAIPNLGLRHNMENANKEQDLAVSSWHIDERIIDILDEALRHPNRHVRGATIYVLGKIGDEKAKSLLISALKDLDSVIRASAAYALGNIGDVKVIDELVEALNDEFWEVRAAAAYALGKIGDERAIMPLSRLLDDAAPTVCDTALWALASINSEKARKLVAQIVRAQQSTKVRCNKEAFSSKWIDINKVRAFLNQMPRTDDEVACAFIEQVKWLLSKI